jgi:hypothetical protein
VVLNPEVTDMIVLAQILLMVGVVVGIPMTVLVVSVLGLRRR